MIHSKRTWILIVAGILLLTAILAGTAELWSDSHSGRDCRVMGEKSDSTFREGLYCGYPH